MEESLVWIDLPSNLKVGVGQGDASYPVVSIWGLGEIDGKSEELVLKSLGESLGLWLQTAVRVDGEASLDGLLDRLLSFRGIGGMSWLDRYMLYRDVSSLAAKGIVLETNLPQQVMDKVQDPDGYEWLELNEAVFVWSRDLWPKEEVVNLGVKIEVVNASGVPGAARRKARQLESVGFRVVRVETGEKIDKPCLVKIKPDIREKNGLLKQVVEDYLSCEVEVLDKENDFFGEVVFFVG